LYGSKMAVARRLLQRLQPSV